MALLLLAGGDSLAGHGYLPESDSDLVKDYLQPAATFALALAIASLGFTLPPAIKAYGDTMTVRFARGTVLDVSTCDVCN